MAASALKLGGELTGATGSMLVGAGVNYVVRRGMGEKVGDPSQVTAEEWLMQGAALALGHVLMTRVGAMRNAIAALEGDRVQAIRNHAALKGMNIPRTGRPGVVGSLTTKALVISGEAGFGPTPTGARGAMLRAYDKATGREVGAVYLPAPQTGSPMTYMLNGRQYIVVAVSGAGHSGELIAFRLPS